MQRLGFVIYPGCSLMGLAAAPAFEVANLIGDENIYDFHFVSEHGGPIRSSAGMNVETEAFGDTAFDTLIIGGGTFVMPSTPGLIALISKHRSRPGAWPRSAQGPSSSGKLVCSTAGGPQRTGCMHARCKSNFHNAWSMWTVSSSTTARSGPQPA